MRFPARLPMREPERTPLALGGRRGGLRFHYYVAGVGAAEMAAGSDSNSGRSPSKPWATVGKLFSANVMVSGVKVALEGEFREECNLSTLDRVTLEGLGGGFTLRGDDPIPASAWSATGGGVYQAALAIPGGSNRVQLWDPDGLWFTHVADSGDVADAAGNFNVADISSTTSIIYMRPFSGGDPGGLPDGSYRYTRRQYCINSSGNDITIRNCTTMRQGQADGSLRLTGLRSLVEDWTGKDGHKHIALISDGVMRRTRTENAIDWVEGGGNQLVCYATDGADKSVVIENHTFTDDFNQPGPSHFYSHTGANNFALLRLVDCVSEPNAGSGGNTNTRLAWAEADRCELIRPQIIGATRLAVVHGGAGTTMYMEDPDIEIVGDGTTAGIQSQAEATINEIVGGTITAENFVSLFNFNVGSDFENSFDGVTLELGDYGSEYALYQASGTLAWNNMTINQGGSSVNVMRIESAVTFEGDDNAYNRDVGVMKWRKGATTYTGLAAWQAAVTPAEANSTVTGEYLAPDPAYDWLATTLALPTGSTFARTGSRDYLNSSGVWAAASANTPRFDYQWGYPGLLLCGARTNKVTAAKSNPSATTNCTTSGDAGGVLSVVDESAALGATFAKYGPNVYKIDNSAGSTAFYVRFGGTTGGTSAHSLSVIARGAGDFLLYDGTTETAATALDGASYARKFGHNKTPANSSQEFAVKCGAGEIAYVVVPQLEAQPYADVTPIPGGTGSQTVNAETLTRTASIDSGGATIVLDAITAPGIQTKQALWELSDGTSSERYTTHRNNTGAMVVNITAGGNNSCNLEFGATGSSTRVKIAQRVQVNSFRAATDGTSELGDTSGNLPAATSEKIGHSINASCEWGGWILQLPLTGTGHRGPLSNDHLIALSKQGP